MSTLLKISSIECRYEHRTAVHDLSLSVEEGSLVSLLGPSGCGKTTVLRAIAGFEPLLKGEIYLGGKLISRPGYTLAPEKRKLGMVFQDYALFPHMNVSDNICFGLRDMSGLSKRHIANSMLKVVSLTDMGERFPHELSGGQQQRVALARALSAHPDLILMDEPFSNLDIDLRERLSNEVRNILKGQGITGILVTHDQHEAFAICDEVGVMYEGHIQQWSSPYKLYHEPVNRFVADFIGQGVFLHGTLSAADTIETEIGTIRAEHTYELPAGTEVDLLLRPDDVVPDNNSELKGIVRHKAFKGAEIMYTLKLSTGSTILSIFPSHHDHEIGEKIGVRIEADHVVAFPTST